MGHWKLVLPRAKNPDYLLWPAKYMDALDNPMFFNLKSEVSEQNYLSSTRQDLLSEMLLKAARAREQFGDFNQIGTASRFLIRGL